MKITITTDDGEVLETLTPDDETLPDDIIKGFPTDTEKTRFARGCGQGVEAAVLQCVRVIQARK